MKERNIISLLIALSLEIYLTLTTGIYEPYTSNIGLFFITVGLFVYTSNFRTIFKIILLCIIAVLGSYVKITVLIPFIAISLVHIYRDIRAHRFKRIIHASVIYIFILLIASVIRGIELNRIGYERDLTVERGALFFIALGQNNGTNGKFNSDIWTLAEKKYTTKQERDTVFINLILKNIKERGIVHQPQFYLNKTFYTFGDTQADTYNKAGLVSYFIYVRQLIWIVALALMTLFVIKIRNKYIAPFVLSIVGVLCYTWLLESASRYVIMFSPIFFLMAGLSFIEMKINSNNTRLQKI